LIHYLIERPPLAVLYLLLWILPLRFFHHFAHILGKSVSRLLPGHTRRIINNLNYAYGDTLSYKEKKRIAEHVTITLLKSFLEVAYTIHRKNKATVINAITIEGRHHLDQALRKGNGVIAVSAHFGNFAVIGLKMRASGYLFSTVIREITDPYHNRLYERYQKKLDQLFIPSRSFTQVMKSILPALSNNEIVLFIMDENYRRRHGVFVDFFNHKAATAPGAALLSLRAQAPIIPMFMLRNPDQSNTLVIEPEIVPPDHRDHKEAVLAITQHITGRIEDRIRSDPGQWFWTQKRWRTRPPEEKKVP